MNLFVQTKCTAYSGSNVNKHIVANLQFFLYKMCN